MMGEMGIDWGSAGGYRAAPDYTSQLVAQLEQMKQAARQAAADVSSWAVAVVGGAAADWAGYPCMRRQYQDLYPRARRQNERQMRRRRHAGHHGGIRWATYVRAMRKQVPAYRWVMEGKDE